MARIRVDPDNLRRASQQLLSIADRLRALGSEAYQITLDAPSYEGQFGPKARAMGMEAEARLRSQADRIAALSEELKARAAAFEAVDLEVLASFERLTQLLRGWIEQAKPILTPYTQIALFPWQKVDRHLRLGYLIEEPGDENGEGEEEEWSSPWWAPMIIGAEKVWSAFDASVGEPIRDLLTGRAEDKGLETDLTEVRICPLITTIGLPFSDVEAKENKWISGHMAFGSPPFSIPAIDPNSPEMKLKGGSPVWWLQVVDLANTLLSDHATANYMENLEANVDFKLYYSTYDDGMRIPGLTVTNNSEVPVLVARVEIHEWDRLSDEIRFVRQSHYIELEKVIRPGELELIYLESLEDHFFADARADVYIIAIGVTSNPQWGRIGWSIDPDGSAISLSPGW